jgi:hypothetical protein
MSLAWSQNPYPWSDAHVSATFAIGLALVICLVIYEWRGRKDGMFHHELFIHRNFTLALLCVFAEGVVFFCANNFFAYEVSVLFSTDSLVTGAHYCIAFVAYAASAIFTGLWCSKRQTVRIPSVVAFGSFVIFNILMATVSSSTTESQIWGFPVFLGVGLGMCLTALVTAAHFATPRELIAITSGLMISIRSLGGSVGLAIYNAIFSSGLSKNLGPEIAAAVLPKGLSPSELPKLIPALMNHDDQALQRISGATPEIIASGYAGLKEAYVLSFRYVWVTAGCISFAALVGKSRQLLTQTFIVFANEIASQLLSFYRIHRLSSTPRSMPPSWQCPRQRISRNLRSSLLIGNVFTMNNYLYTPLKVQY